MAAEYKQVKKDISAPTWIYCPHDPPQSYAANRFSLFPPHKESFRYDFKDFLSTKHYNLLQMYQSYKGPCALLSLARVRGDKLLSLHLGRSSKYSTISALFLLMLALLSSR